MDPQNIRITTVRQGSIIMEYEIDTQDDATFIRINEAIDSAASAGTLPVDDVIDFLFEAQQNCELQ